KELKEKLETSDNPMVMVVKAQLKSLEVQGSDNQQKFEVTKELIRECGLRGYTRDATKTMLRFFEWVIRLPKSFDNRLNVIFKQLEEEKKMEFLAAYERVALKKGKKEGKKEGKREGMKEGKEKEKQEIARNMAKMKFDLDTIKKITGLDKNKLNEIIASVN
ncbi:MAG: hypothetical protein ACM3SY_05150, partial [Candidatus Omnitrophota bacterium]